MSMQALMAASQTMARMQTMQSARSQMQSSANILRIESKQDGGDLKKLAVADELEKKSSNLMGDLMDEIDEVKEILKPNETKAEEGVEDTKSLKKSSKTDTVELSDFATKQLDNQGKAKIAVLKAVTYGLDGSTKPSTSDNCNAGFDVKG